jgi:hypothetical protein
VTSSTTTSRHQRPLPGQRRNGRRRRLAIIGETSAASPQIAGVCALLKQAQPGQAPDLVKAVLKAPARDVVDGKNAMGDPADDGVDVATGAGLVDAEAAYRITRSRALCTAPPPR